MPDESGLDYGRMMQRALRQVMAEALGAVAENGLPGDHHFYITFDPSHPGVVMPDWLRERYPRELTIVLQHEFHDLAVLGDRFQVGLSFSGRVATLTVPFDAVETFIDPSVKFGLKFDDHGDDEADFEGEGAGGGAHGRAEGGADGTAGGRGGAEGRAEGDEDGDGNGDGGGPQGSADIVSLDRFRKP